MKLGQGFRSWDTLPDGFRVRLVRFEPLFDQCLVPPRGGLCPRPGRIRRCCSGHSISVNCCDQYLIYQLQLFDLLIYRAVLSLMIIKNLMHLIFSQVIFRVNVMM